jgi:hypothetical protein
MPTVPVLVLIKDEHSRSTLNELLIDAGYVVTLAKDWRETETVIDAAPESMVFIVGEASGVDYRQLHVYTVFATHPMRQHVYVYLNTVPERIKLPALARLNAESDASTGDMPGEVEPLLALVAAAARARPESLRLGVTLDQETHDTTPL